MADTIAMLAKQYEHVGQENPSACSTVLYDAGRLARAYLAARNTPVSEKPSINQCDGCRRGLPLRANNIHYDGEFPSASPVMGCTKDRYEHPSDKASEDTPRTDAAAFVVRAHAVGFALQLVFLRLAYRHLMRLTHYFGWHYAPIRPGPDGEGYRWCHWCGLRGAAYDKQVIRTSAAKSEEK